MNRFSVGIWAYGNCCDRFNEGGYQRTRSFREKIAQAAETAGLDGVEIHFAGDFDSKTALETSRIVKESGLTVSAVNVNTFGTAEFKHGAFTSPYTSVRELTIDRTIQAAEAAQILGTGLINLWPGSDGYDMPFQVDHAQQWQWMVEGLEQVATRCGDVRFALEYKHREPRVRSTIDSAAKALLACLETGCSNLGVTLDFGHSLQCKENPAQAASLLSHYKKLFHLHLNDNSRDWDDDLIVGCYHIPETVELMTMLRGIEYSGWLGLDMSPARDNQVDSVAHSISLLKYFRTVAEKSLQQGLANELAEHQSLRAQKIVQNVLFTAGGSHA